ncbi:MAG TPA: SRPBCC domain-containing protein [Jatrophihabitantaceae bacterium]|jgi:uncharacterized protein YndB with AHSA1/START domain
MVEFTIVRVFDAPREAVWRAWTDPEQLAQWFGPRGVSTPLDKIRMDLRPGGVASLVMVDDASGTEYPNSGTYLEVVPPERLVWKDDGFPDGTGAGTVTVRLRNLGGKTELALHVVADFTDEMRAQAGAGWGSSFDRLGELLARR